ncbi:MAG: hypothetical protein M9887_09145 [Chitinophagales bacterium]|nr:hypothetical protein [Chitinophagales bacterium]
MSQRFLLFLFILPILFGCERFKEKESQRNINFDLDRINVDTVKLHADKNTEILVRQLGDVYTSSFPEAKLDITYDNDHEVKEAIYNNDSRLVIRLQAFDTDEMEYIHSVYKTKPIQHTFAYDAIALVKDKSETDTLIKYPDLQQIIQQGEDKFVSTQEHMGMFAQLLTKYGITEGKRVLKTVENIDDLQRFLNLHPEYIGLLPFSLVSNPSSQKAADIISKFNWVAIQDTLGHIIHPSQSTIYTKEWPFILPYTVTYCNLSLKKGVGFVKFIHSRPAQKLILKAGLIPYTMPERLVIIKDMGD